MTPTARTLAYCKKHGLKVANASWWNSFARRRMDTFGMLDLWAWYPGSRTLVGVQVCAGSSHAARRKKIRENEWYPRLIAVGIPIEVWSWSKCGARGKRKTWELRREAVEG